jgi:hypothetical protein
VICLGVLVGCALDPADEPGGNGGQAGSAGAGVPSAGKGGSGGSTAGSSAQAGDDAGQGGEASPASAGEGGEAGATVLAGAGGEPSAGTGGTPPVVAGASGEESGGAGGEGGSCVPLTPEEVCAQPLGEGRSECGAVSDGCGGEVACGECLPTETCDVHNATENRCHTRPECECFAECGLAPGCPVAVLCGPNEGTCGSDPSGNNACVNTDENSVRRRCDRLPTAGSNTCCAAKEPECRTGFVDAPQVYAVNIRTGEDCGSCDYNGAAHYCGPGWVL